MHHRESRPGLKPLKPDSRQSIRKKDRDIWSEDGAEPNNSVQLQNGQQFRFIDCGNRRNMILGGIRYEG